MDSLFKKLFVLFIRIHYQMPYVSKTKYPKTTTAERCAKYFRLKASCIRDQYFVYICMLMMSRSSYHVVVYYKLGERLRKINRYLYFLNGGFCAVERSERCNNLGLSRLR